jgi:hypothetical protein
VDINRLKIIWGLMQLNKENEGIVEGTITKTMRALG